MAAELRRPRRELIDHAPERLARDLLGQRLALAGLPVEVAAVADSGRDAAERDAELGRFRHGDRAERLAQMDVLVGVEMRGLPPDERAKGLELPPELLL